MRLQLRVTPALAILSLAVLSACGGSGGASGVLSTFSGVVVDGYIEGAKVCLDLNDNQACDANEPSATSKAGGSYSLDISGVDAEKLQAAHLLTFVPDSAKDADDGGKTLKEAGKQAFVLMAPVAAFVNSDGRLKSAVISPLTTLVSHEMITGSNTLETSEKYVRTRLNLDESTDLRQDFVSKKDGQLSEKAQMLAVAMGEVKAAVLADNSKPSERDAFLAALTYLQTQAGDLQKAYDDAKRADSSTQAVDLVKKVWKDGLAKPAILLGEAKKVTTSTPEASLVAVLEQGIYTTDLSRPANDPSSYYSYLKGSDGKISLNRSYNLNEKTWQLESNDSNGSWILVNGKGWVPEGYCSAGRFITYASDISGGATFTSCNGITEKVTARTVDASGKTLEALGLEASEDYKGVSMPSGSVLYWLLVGRTADDYQISTGSKVSNPQNNNTDISSVDAFITIYSTKNNLKNYKNGLIFSFDEGGTSSGGKVTLWGNFSYVNYSYSKIGSADYERRTVDGQEVLIIKTAAPYGLSGDRIMFAVKDGALYSGYFTPASAKKSPLPFFNKTMVNAILKAGQKPEVLN